MLLHPNVAFTHREIPGQIDRIDIDSIGLIRVSGWYASEELPEISLNRRAIDAVSLRPTVAYRTRRGDLIDHGICEYPFCGFEAEWINISMDGLINRVFDVHIGGAPIVKNIKVDKSCGYTEPHYVKLFDTPEVLHRNDIYGYGPPSDVNLDVLSFAMEHCEGKILDFGCGNGE